MKTTKIHGDRRTGKTTMLIDRAIWQARFGKQRVLILVHNQQTVLSMTKALRERLDEFKAISTSYGMVTESVFDFDNGSEIRVLAAGVDPKELRPDHLLVDNADGMNYKYVLGMVDYLKPETFVVTYTNEPKVEDSCTAQ